MVLTLPIAFFQDLKMAVFLQFLLKVAALEKETTSPDLKLTPRNQLVALMLNQFLGAYRQTKLVFHVVQQPKLGLQDHRLPLLPHFVEPEVVDSFLVSFCTSYFSICLSFRPKFVDSL